MVSVQCQGTAVAVLGGWQALPEDLKSHVPLVAVLGLAMALLVMGIAGRLVQQKSVNP